MSEIDYAPFLGDGRVKQPCLMPITGCENTAVTNATARMRIRSFVEHRQSTHSGMGATLWVIVLWCQTHRVPYQLLAHPGEGYFIKRIGTLA